MNSSSCKLQPREEMVSTLGSLTFKLEKLCVMELLALEADLVRSSIFNLSVQYLKMKQVYSKMEIE